MTIPLRPGITSVQPSNAKTGENILLDITGYNTHFDQAKISEPG